MSDVDEKYDPLFVEEEDRNTILPLRYPKLWEAYKIQAACYWQAHEVDLTHDKVDWDSLDTNEQYFLKMILAFFASSDLIVNENLEKRFKDEVKVLEATIGYTFQSMMENVHSEMYALLIDTYITNHKEKDRLFNAIKTIPIIGKKAEWARKWIDSKASFAERLVAFSCVEGILFSGAFCSIYWIKERGKLPGLCKSNDFISRDEGQHVDWAVLLHSMLREKITAERLHQIVAEAVAIEIEFITEALPCKLIGMNSDLMKQYIMFVANRLVKQYGYPELYPKAVQPFTFMDRIGLKSKSNFFEKRPTEYSRKDNSATDAEDPYADL
jgi:ribonucleoside-diphosphate reductase beta chain